MKKLLCSDISNTIYLANAKQMKDNPSLYTAYGDKEDFTNEAIRAVFQWFMNQMKGNEEFTLSFPSAKYELVMREKERKQK